MMPTASSCLFAFICASPMKSSAEPTPAKINKQLHGTMVFGFTRGSWVHDGFWDSQCSIDAPGFTMGSGIHNRFTICNIVAISYSISGCISITVSVHCISVWYYQSPFQGHFRFVPFSESTENWGNSDLVTSPSSGILRVRLFLSRSGWLTFDANTLFSSHNTLCTGVALLLPPISGARPIWANGILGFCSICWHLNYHKPKGIQNSETSLRVIFLCIWDWWIYPRGCVNTLCSVCIHPYILLCVYACLLLLLLPCAGESTAEREEESQAGHEGWYRSLTESTTEQSQRHGR